MLLLDIEKAFDKVWIDGLIHKMINYNYPPTLIKYISSYLKNRHLKVSINGLHSTKRKIRAGVPQGSVLGPTLFNIYINDIPTFPNTKIAMYADDTALYAHSFSAVVAAKQIQIHMNLLEHFYKLWKITLNPTKTEIMIFTKKFKDSKIFQPIKVFGHNTHPTHSVKYLGVYLDSKLTFKKHINETLRKAYAVQKKLYPLMAKNSSLTQANKKLIYTMILRPILVYAAPAWCSAAPTNIKSIQTYQNKCLRLILQQDRYAKIDNMHKQADLNYIINHIRELSNNFYNNKLGTNVLTQNLTSIRSHNLPFKLKHRLPYQNLEIFHT